MDPFRDDERSTTHEPQAITANFLRFGAGSPPLERLCHICNGAHRRRAQSYQGSNSTYGHTCCCATHRYTRSAIRYCGADLYSNKHADAGTNRYAYTPHGHARSADTHRDARSTDPNAYAGAAYADASGADSASRPQADLQYQDLPL